MSPLRIDRCVCTRQTFAQLKAYACRDIDELATCTGAGAACGMCRPYLHAMIQTGKTVFHELLPVKSHV